MSNIKKPSCCDHNWTPHSFHGYPPFTIAKATTESGTIGCCYVTAASWTSEWERISAHVVWLVSDPCRTDAKSVTNFEILCDFCDLFASSRCFVNYAFLHSQCTVYFVDGLYSRNQSSSYESLQIEQLEIVHVKLSTLRCCLRSSSFINQACMKYTAPAISLILVSIRWTHVSRRRWLDPRESCWN